MPFIVSVCSLKHLGPQDFVRLQRSPRRSKLQCFRHHITTPVPSTEAESSEKMTTMPLWSVAKKKRNSPQ